MLIVYVKSLTVRHATKDTDEKQNLENNIK